MAQTPHETNKNATRVSPLPCLVMIILSPLLLLYLVLSLLFVPIDFLIFKTSMHHRDFGGKYSFLGGAHPDNELYSFIKKRGIKIGYIAVPRDKSFVGYFFSDKTLIDTGAGLFWNNSAKSWEVHTGAPTIAGNPSSYTIDIATSIKTAEFKMATGKELTGVTFLLKEKAARRAGSEAYSLALSDNRILVYTKKELPNLLTEIKNKDAEQG